MQKYLPLSNLTAILHSKRANIYYLEKCRVMQKDGRILYLTEGKNESLYWNIPVANTTVIMLGTGTSITQAAVRMLASAGVLIGFCGDGGTPLLAGSEIEWISPQNEYRATAYVQGWLAFWFDEEKRLCVAKNLQKARCNYLINTWEKDEDLRNYGFHSDDYEIEKALDRFDKKIDLAKNVTELLAAEANFAKQLYKYAANLADIDNFSRDPNADDAANMFLTRGNYLAYGLGAVTLWVLGIPHGFAVMHGKTRRGALVFDTADLIKDTIILSQAFICSKEGLSSQEFRHICLQKFIEHKSLEFMFNEIKKQSLIYRKPGDQ